MSTVANAMEGFSRDLSDVTTVSRTIPDASLRKQYRLDQLFKPAGRVAEQLVKPVLLPETRVRNRPRHRGHIGEVAGEPLHGVGNGAHSSCSGRVAQSAYQTALPAGSLISDFHADWTSFTTSPGMGM